MKYRHTLFYCTFFIALLRYLIFYKLKVSSNPMLSKSISGIFFSIAFARFVSLCCILAILSIFQTFFFIIELLSLMLLMQKDYDSLKAQMMVNIC